MKIINNERKNKLPRSAFQRKKAGTGVLEFSTYSEAPAASSPAGTLFRFKGNWKPPEIRDPRVSAHPLF